MMITRLGTSVLGSYVCYKLRPAAVQANRRRLVVQCLYNRKQWAFVLGPVLHLVR
jgi:hypothetical protein